MYHCKVVVFLMLTFYSLPNVFSLICYDCRAPSANSDNCNTVDKSTKTEVCWGAFECVRYIEEFDKGRHTLVRRCNYDSKDDCENYPSCTKCTTDYCNNN